MNLRILALISAATVSQSATAQHSAYTLVTNVKCKAGKAAECDEYLSKTLHKVMQLRVERGVIDSFTLTQLMDPMASEAGYTHTYVVSSSKPFPAEQSAEYRKAAEDVSGMSNADFQTKSNEFRELVCHSSEVDRQKLFADNARNERGGRQAIHDDYAKFFQSSSSRKINFSNISCRPSAQSVTCTAGYSTSVKRKGKLLPETLKGQIELQMSALDNRILIDRIRIGV